MRGIHTYVNNNKAQESQLFGGMFAYLPSTPLVWVFFRDICMPPKDTSHCGALDIVEMLQLYDNSGVLWL